jgi:hypothetical protein
MSWTHFHLVLNHGPVFGIPFGVFFLIVALAKQNDLLLRISYVFFIGLTLLTGIVVWTGSRAVPEVEARGIEIASQLIHPHHKIAYVSFWSMLIIGILAGAGLWMTLQGKAWRYQFLKLFLALLAVTALLTSWAANLGGRIAHLEIRQELPFLSLPDQGGHPTNHSMSE